jgi:broad specificity phosphatase PhoE
MTERTGNHTSTTLYFVRHGKVENPGKVVYERLPGFHLSDFGRRQITATAQWMSSQPQIVRASALYASPLDRTMDTAQIVLAALNRARESADYHLPALSIQTDDRLLEARNRYRGLRINHGEAAWYRHGNIWKFLDLKTPGWGEPYTHIAQRMMNFAFQIADQHAGQSVIVVSHESPIWTLRHILTTGKASSNVLTRHTALGSVTGLTLETGTHRLLSVTYADPAKDVRPERSAQ